MEKVAKLKASVVNFSQFQLESHVEKALQAAWAVSGRETIDASDLLQGVMAVVLNNPSQAFQRLAELLPTSTLYVLTNTGPPLDLAAVPVSTGLAASSSVAEAFLKEGGNRVWGRDFITLALLAKSDASLQELASKAGKNIEVVRREWYEFVRSTDKRRTPDSWKRWWRGAGLALPEGTTAQSTTAASAYVFTWNPVRFEFPELDAEIAKVKASGSTVIKWSTGNRRSMSRGSRVFLVRQGDDQRGLVGVGEVAGDVREEPHWDVNKRQQGEKSFLVDVKWSALSREPLLDLATLIRETGDSVVWSSQASGVAVKPDVAQKLEEAWPRAWERKQSGLRDDSLPDIELKHWIARFDADTGKKEDRLKVDRYVSAFARVIASRALTPPLSIGLFGDWGSGKTFFMDRLYDKIQELAQAPETNPPLYWNRICQMRFNAWHYTETNLWASLVTTIFNELSTFLDPPESDAEQFNRLLNQLEVVQALRKEATDKLDDAIERHNQATRKVSDAENALRTMAPPPPLSDRELRAILADTLSKRLPHDAQSLAKLLDDAGDWSGRSDFKQAAEQVRRGQATVADARKLLTEAGVLASHVGFWWRVLSGARLYKTMGFWIVIALLIAIPIYLPHVLEPSMGESWAHAWTLVGEVITLAGASIAWARSQLAGAGSVFDRLASLRTDIENEIEVARSKDRIAFETERDKALAAENIAREQLEQAKREEALAAEAERKAREALRDSTSQARLGRFIRERTSSADYEKHLGLIAMIHRDFEKLSRLMVSASQQNADPNLPRIDRIVLYIDDLDRCHPPDKVVRVLEAVHLLLFFPLFVVVVGVDSRWVSRSLYRHYEGMLADEAIGPEKANDLQRAPAESQDFLEKIFQVPFWLRRMDPTAVQRLLHQLITPSEVEAPPPLLAPPVGSDTTATGPAGANAAAGAPQGTATSPENPDLAAAKRTTAEAEVDGGVVETLTTPSESLRITERELQYMDQVAPLMPRTPRSIKRFVNIYRLYKAALAPQAFARFTGSQDRPGNFRAVQVLLALVTGVPRLAQRVFIALHAGESTATPEKLSALVVELEKDEEEDEAWQTTLAALRTFAERNSLELSELREVAPLVSRYSVHHMISKAPGEAGLG